MEPAWAASWAWGLSLIALSILIHAIGIVVIALGLERIGKEILRRRRVRWRAGLIVAAVFAVVGLLLAMLHGFEAGIWAVAYLIVGALGSYRDSILFSLDCMTTRGAVGMELATRWQLMGALEAADGMLVFGISTAFLFAVLQQILPMIQRGGSATGKPVR